MNMKDSEEKTAEVEIEGGGWNWFYVCGECHSLVDSGQERCRQCGRRLIWDDRQS